MCASSCEEAAYLVRRITEVSHRQNEVSSTTNAHSIIVCGYRYVCINVAIMWLHICMYKYGNNVATYMYV